MIYRMKSVLLILLLFNAVNAQSVPKHYSNTLPPSPLLRPPSPLLRSPSPLLRPPSPPLRQPSPSSPLPPDLNEPVQQTQLTILPPQAQLQPQTQPIIVIPLYMPLPQHPVASAAKQAKCSMFLLLGVALIFH